MRLVVSGVVSVLTASLLVAVAPGHAGAATPDGSAGRADRRHLLLGVPGRQLVARRRQRPAACTGAAGSGSRTCRPAATCTPTSGRRTATGPTTASRSPSSAAGTARCGCGSTTPARATGCATRSAGTPGSRAAAAPTATGTRSSSTRSNCKLYETFATRMRQRPLARRVGRGLVPAQQPPAPRRLDLRRRRRAADPARAAALERGARPARSTTRSGSPPTSPPRTTSGRPGTTPARGQSGPTRRWARGSGSRRASPPRGFGADAREVIRAMKKYGLVLADNGSPWFFQGEQNRHWPDAADRGPQADPGPRLRRRRHLLAEGLERQRRRCAE